MTTSNTPTTLSRRDALSEQLQALAGQFAASSPLKASFAHQLREDARTRLASLPIPTTKMEEWRFTQLNPLLGISFDTPETSLPDSTDLSPYILPEAATTRLTFINGSFTPSLSSNDAQGFFLGSLSEAFQAHPDLLTQHLDSVADFSDDPFAAANSSSLHDAACVILPKEASASQPIHLLFLSSSSAPTASFPRLFVFAHSDSKALVIEDHVSLHNDETQHLTTSHAEFFLQPNARVDHIKTIRDSAAGFHVARTGVFLQDHAQYHSVTLSSGARIFRHDLRAKQAGPGTHCQMHGLAIVHGDQLSDTHSVMDHAKPHGTSDQVHKIIAGGHGRAVFNGKIFVRLNAQKTAAEQLSRGLLLSKRARIDTKPQLEIFADDVRCTHGATIGQLDSDPLFYLQARGVDPETAHAILIQAFARDILDHVEVPTLREALDQVLLEQLKHAL